jgi:hypothetical protein
MSDNLHPSFIKILLGIHYLLTAMKKRVAIGKGRETLPTCAI